MMNLMQEFNSMKYRLCLMEKVVSKLLLLRVNDVDNKVQSVLNLVNSASVQFQYREDGKVAAVTTGGGGGTGGIGIELADHYSTISVSADKRFIYVITDETNNNDISLYIYTGVALKFLQTIAP